MRGIKGVILVGLITFTGCNPYSLVDSPSGDAQILAAARACFDKGDFACASAKYALLSTASNDEKISETAYQTLAQNGATMGEFMNAFVNGASSGGKFLTRLAGALSSGSGETRRLAIFSAYKTYNQITNTQLQGLVRFLTSAALVAEILGEEAAVSGTVSTSDLVATPSTCSTSGIAFTGCGIPSGATILNTATLTSGGTTISTSTANSDLSGSPTLAMIKAALSELSSAVTQMSAGGGVGSQASQFAALLTVVDVGGTLPTGGPEMFRGVLIRNDIGAQ